MTNFKMTFNHPWLLLLIIPAVLLTLVPYFRLTKKYRATRNNIISMSCHIIASLLAICLLAGIGFAYDIPNENNEVILLVDRSDSTATGVDDRDELVRSLIGLCPEGTRLGIVTYGYGCEYAVPLTDDREELYEKYLGAEAPDGSASGLADALKYTATLFEVKESAKIVVISDGIETDGDARLALYGIVSEGITVDTAMIEKGVSEDIQITSATVTAAEIVIGEPFPIELLIESNSTPSEEAAVLRLYDNGVLYGEMVVSIKNGLNELPVSLTLTTHGIHELTFELVTDYELFGEPLGDGVSANNRYSTFVNLREMENILVVERYENESFALRELLSATKTVTDMSVESDLARFPTSLAEMAAYEQVILVNIAYADMPAGFEELLNEYVYSLGGGLFTVGGRNDIGTDGKPVPHAYNRTDLEASTYYKNMLPVNAEDYTPPIAVMLVVDTSLSMKSTGKLSAAIDGAKVCLDALHDRDYCGIVSFSSASSERLSVLPVSQRETIAEAISKIEDEAGGGTIFSDAIMKAGRALSVINNVERKHIILITDGKPGDAYEDYEKYIKDNIADGITMSVMTVGIDDVKKEADMRKAASVGGGKFYNVTDVSSIAGTMYRDLTEEAIPEIAYGREFSLTVKDKNRILTGIDPMALPTLTGYFGTVAKKDATVVLMGEYVPIYAVHKYGRGTVGSFMSDLGGEWSATFMSSVVGQALVTNIVESIFPFEAPRADGIRYEVSSDNYNHWINLHGIPDGQTAEVAVNPVSSHLQHLYGEIAVDTAESGRRFTFTLTEGGVYEILITLTDEVGQTRTLTVHRAFAYSEEYDSFSGAVGNLLMAELATVGGGSEIDDPAGVYASLKDTVRREYDPSAVMIITAIILVLIDIAVRKFKIKWLHEIIREQRNEKG